MSAKCPICDAFAEDSHFGSTVPVCQACSAFFRRFVLSSGPIECKNGARCEIKFKSRKSCRFCRMQQCLEVGMKITSVQPARDKYNNTPSTSTSNSETLPESCARLQKLHKNYLKLKSAREEVYNKKPGDKPKYRNLLDTLEILRQDMKLVSNFLEGSFGGESGPNWKLLFQNFYSKFMYFEPTFNSVQAGNLLSRAQNEQILGISQSILPNGDYIDTDLGKFYTSHTRKSPKINKESAKIYFQQYWDEYDRTMVQEMELLKLDIFEFLTVSALIFWDTGLEDLSPKSVEKCLKMRAEIVSEIQIYYENVKNVADPCIRLCQVMMLLPSIQKSFNKFQEELEMCGVLDVYQQIPNDTYKIVHDSLSF